MALKQILKKYNIFKSCIEQDLSTKDFERIESLLERNNITQIIFTYGINSVLCLINLFEFLEEYETCEIIRKKIIIHNKNTNKEYKTHL